MALKMSILSINVLFIIKQRKKRHKSITLLKKIEIPGVTPKIIILDLPIEIAMRR